MARVQSIRDVAERHLCAGCGVCAYLAPESIRMVDDLERGRRPIVEGDADSDGGTGDAFVEIRLTGVGAVSGRLAGVLEPGRACRPR